MIVQCVNLFLLLASANGFNLEPRIPVMKNGMAGSYFGYSVAQHQSVSAETGAILNNWWVHFLSIYVSLFLPVDWCGVITIGVTQYLELFFFSRKIIWWAHGRHVGESKVVE